MGISLVVVGIAFRFVAQAPAGTAASAGPSAADIVTMLALVVLIACFAFSIGPVVWKVINEIFRGDIRGRAVAVATAVNWGATFLVSQTFLSLAGAIGNSLTFGVFAVFCLISWAWIYDRVPETRGQSLEQIQQI
jgi:MFS transporter, SP family, galactose:H+ symporter